MPGSALKQFIDLDQGVAAQGQIAYRARAISLTKPGQRRDFLARRLASPMTLHRACAVASACRGECSRRATGVGKSWLASALGHKACRDNRSVLYQRIPKLFADLSLARGDGRYARIQRSLGGVQLLILDDWGLEPFDAAARHDLLEILEE
jgi:hypothetical protein